MTKIICIIIVLVTAIIGCIVMKRIEPDNKWFPAYVFGIVLMVALMFKGTTS